MKHKKNNKYYPTLFITSGPQGHTFPYRHQTGLADAPFFLG
ncbi:hypothetical protein NEISUBOT_04973 [Neisseria subflava NJ9703]|uniref:Uncharacterized protein n=1 Tax=Neisseria subflava NJ9703 TaxID=546268 RepID=A0A9W5IPP1_NEISU|nr:hypothetical protein NEISUBOT_04973 [Neisseria subflava NJ9703]